MLNRMRIHEFDPVIYPYKLWVIVDKSPKDIPSYFLDNEGNELKSIEEDTAGADGFSLNVINKDLSHYGALIFFKNKKSMTYKLVAHEASHAAKFLFEHIEADMREHEPFEYVVGWIAECCEKVKRGKV